MKSTVIVLMSAVLLYACEPSVQDSQQGTTARGSTQQDTSAQEDSVAVVNGMKVGSYVTVTGNITGREREDYFTFSDGTGRMRVQIQDSVMRGREFDPNTRVRLTGEIDSGPEGRYLWVKSVEEVN